MLCADFTLREEVMKSNIILISYLRYDMMYTICKRHINQSRLRCLLYHVFLQFNFVIEAQHLCVRQMFRAKPANKSIHK